MSTNAELFERAKLAIPGSSENIRYWQPIDEPDVPAEQLKGHM